jgi:hypothetical protein
MNLKESYVAIVLFLNNLYFNYNFKSDALGTLLGSMDPFNFENEKGLYTLMDKSKFDDWEQLLTLTTANKNDVTPLVVFTTLIRYLEFHIKQFNFNFHDLVITLQEMHQSYLSHPELWEEWDESVKQAKFYSDKLDFED